MSFYRQLPGVVRPVATRTGVCIIMLVSGTFLYSCKSNSSSVQNKTTAATNTDSLAQANATLQTQYDGAHLQADALVGKVTLLDSQVRAKDAQIAQLNGEIARLRKNNKSLNDQLKKSNQLLASLRNELGDKARSFAERIGLLEADRDKLGRQRDSLSQQYTSLKELGSVLHASNFRLEPVKIKHNGRIKHTTKARKVNELSIRFDIDENRIADAGTKKLYLSITGPDGRLLSTTENNSGNITTATGTSVAYSLQKDVALQRDEPVYDVSVNWKQDKEYLPGTYSIVIYNGGYKIGGGSVTLR